MSLPHINLRGRQRFPDGSGSTPYDRFLHQVQRAPDAIAIDFEGLRLSYATLSEKIDTQAEALASLGVRRNHLVAVHLARGVEMMVSTLAILKLGAGFLPLDTALPYERKRFILKDAKPILCLSEVSTEGFASEKCVNPSALNSPNSTSQTPVSERGELAYVIYTSGSTGKPKGVAVSNESLLHFFTAVTHLLDLGQQDRFIALTTFGFDIALLELLLPLTLGGTCHLVSSSMAKEADQLVQLIRNVNPTVLQATPSAFEMLLAEGWSPDPRTQILCGGEAWPPDLFEKMKSAAAVWNAYGPTEATIWTSLTHIDKSRDLTGYSSLPITRHFPGAYLVAMDSSMTPVGTGEVGELFIGGPGLAEGYYHNAAMTTEKFFYHHFEDQLPVRLYRTGDLVRVLSEDEYHYIGRTDHQLKVRGHRMEAGDIEHHLLLHPAIERCIVDVYEDQQGKHLVAWYKETELEQDKIQTNIVNDWGELYDDTYRQSHDTTSEFDTSGWNSAYTGLPIPQAQMRRWVDHTVSRLFNLKPEKVIEIGCGTGLIMYPLINKGVDYTGLDLSASAIDRHEQRFTEQALTHCRVLQASADKLSTLPKSMLLVDTVVINSVIQYFPDKAYLDNVIRDSLTILTEGQIFIGDVIDLRLQDAYYASLIRHQNPQADRDSVMREISQRRELENELFVAPEYFLNLANECPTITGVALMPKQLDDENELCRYRYDVVLYLGRDCESLPTSSSIVWTPALDLESCLSKGTDSVMITGYPRQNLCNDWRFLKSVTPDQELNYHSLSVEQLVKLSARYGYQLQTTLEIGHDDNAFFMSVYFSRAQAKPIVHRASMLTQATTNTPFQQSARPKCSPTSLRAYCEEVLPYYMCPDIYIRLEQFPLTANGKVDRNSLPAPMFRSHLEVAPEGKMEMYLADVWTRVLKLDFPVSRHDRFFEIGGQSLSAIRIASEIKQAFSISIHLSDLLRATTIAEQAALVTEQQIVGQLRLARIEQETYPLSSSQERLWFKAELDPNHTAYHVQERFAIKGKVHADALEEAFNVVIQHHEILRTTYHVNEGKVVQRIEPYDHQFQLERLELTKESDTESIETLLDTLRSRVINSQRDLMLQASLIAEETDQYLLAIHYHHLAIDDWSLEIIRRDLSRAYKAIVYGQEVNFESIPLRYHDYALWQRSEHHDNVTTPSLRYWQEQLKGIPQLHALQTDHVRGPEQGSQGATVRIELDESTSMQFLRLCQSQDATLFMGMNALLALLLQRFGCGEDIVVGAPIANREIGETSSLVGFFVNTIVLRTSLSGELSFLQLLRQCRERALEAYQHQHVPFDRIVEHLAPDRDKSFHPIFQVMMMVKSPLSLPSLVGLEIVELPQTIDSCLFDLEVHVEECDGKIIIDWLYDTQLFEPQTITHMTDCFEHLFREILSEPQTNIHRLPCVSLPSLKKVQNELKPPILTLPERLFVQMQQQPQATAVIDGDVVCSYQMLYKRARQIGAQLQHLGVGAGDCVAIALPRSLDLVATILGVWHANAAFLILDHQGAVDRTSHVILDAEPALIVHDAVWSVENASRTNMLTLTDLESGTSEEYNTNTAALQSLAYINYTSGSTGKPKGVKVTHESLASLIPEWQEVLSLTNQDRWLQMANATFDVFIADVCRALSSGAALVLCPDSVKLDPRQLLAFMSFHQVTIGDFVPATVRALVEVLNHSPLNGLRLMVIGSDKWYWSDYRALRQVLSPETRVFNCYGTTETTIDNIWYQLPVDCPPQEGMIPLGSPYNNAEAFVLDHYGNLCPTGVWGELHLGGACLSAGYVSSQRNEGRFYEHAIDQQPIGRLYATGDIVRWNHTAQLELQGRTDDQIKLRGYRIELDEIQSCIEQVPCVGSAIVCFNEPQQRISAFIKVKGEQDPTVFEQVHHQLHAGLPAYMHPGSVTVVDMFPVTANGKIDRPALLDGAVGTQAPSGRALSDTEARVAAIWARITQSDQARIQARSSFFDAGGHSLQIYRCLAEIDRIFDVSLDARLFFELASLERVSGQIDIALSAKSHLTEADEDIGFFI